MFPRNAFFFVPTHKIVITAVSNIIWKNNEIPMKIGKTGIWSNCVENMVIECFLFTLYNHFLVWYNRHTFPWCTKHLIWFVCTLNLSITQGSLTDTPMSVKTWYLPNRALMITYKIQHTTKDHSCWNSRKCLSTRIFTLISKLMQIDYTIEHCRVYHILPVIGNWCGF